mmetsp:Transcript_13391/g.19725  ORF Transcript_13391/g.19725 Transcript_13391/m.19725 type:complete len:258 (-) Transcript_13391:87-860(-)|eukprot:CAMPEP_0194216344 /NCGR_PEP_ID=MMETSP0156-20130528/18812_1 /TAXON_ID=33649 /ORGANISM="Thalassionema nitzschioides, Strain L26-B" /LENGTH=257 /DNA_ID=CAMNT_0038945093 /DNA_START=68 /DNA_END=841 /DNA_ORIENTATION=-
MPYSDNAVQAASVAIRSIQGRKSDYESGIRQNEELAKHFGANIVENLGPALEDFGDSENLQQFLQEQKQRLVVLTEQAVNQHRKVGAFCQALENMQHSLVQDDIKYESNLAAETKKLQKNKENLNMDQEPSVREMKQTLGLLSEDAGEEDAELEVIPTQSSQSLKCPITGALYENPVKNNVCHHVYSLEALKQYVRSKNGRNVPCPVAGCINTTLTLASCVEDPTSAMRVKKQQRLAARDHELRMSQAASVDESDEE